MKATKRLDKKLCKEMACPAILEAENNNMFFIGENLGTENGQTVIKVPKSVFDSVNSVK